MNQRTIKSTGAAFSWVKSNHIHMYSVNAHVNLGSVTVALMNHITTLTRLLEHKQKECTHTDEYVTELQLHETDLMLTTLEQVGGLALAIANTIDDIEEGQA